jgi:hypothetical protein
MIEIEKKNVNIPRGSVIGDTINSIMYTRRHTAKRSAASYCPSQDQRRVQKELRDRCTGRHRKSHAMRRHRWQRRLQCKN